ncbi:tetratricopeptide repeat-containing glycosyltransferase family 2 protein [Tundrisphaera lichenicola]|uniref:tetratricopeptide repeat-containing glycosyltransferase family 2 protein n=1 Tax=Tundrisphaera lichenicola TaxID=2029860 RepID=UPI003EBFCA55
MRPMVSLAMIVRDEADHLDRCLGSAVDLVDDVVVVDTGSTDSTREIARGRGARVIEFPWLDSFSEARNESLRRAEGGWVFWLDADEWLDDEARGRLRGLFASLGDDETVYLMQQASDSSIHGRDQLSVTQPRLFRNIEAVRWRYRIHEQILDAWRVRGAAFRDSGVVIRHSGYQTAEQTRRKYERNLRLMARDVEDNPDDPWALFQLGRGNFEERFPVAEGLFLRALGLPGATGLMSRQIYGMLARGYRERGESARARRVVREGLSRHPGDSILLFESGCLAMGEGDLGTAGEAFGTLLDSSTDGEERLIGTYESVRGWRARVNLASVRYREGRLDEAERQWRLALDDRPDTSAAWLGLGELYLNQARWDDLDRAIERLRELSPESSGSPLLLLRAQAHLAREEFPQARDVLRQLIEREPGSTDPRMLLGWSYLLEGEDLGSAERTLREVLRADPDHAEARRGLEAIRGLRAGRI